MGLQVQTGTLLIPSATGGQTVATCFEPVGVLLFGCGDVGVGYGSGNGALQIGVSDASFSGCVSARRDDGVAGGGLTTFHNASDTLAIVRGGNAVLSGTGANSFTLNWTLVSDVGRRIHWVAFGGDTCEAKAGKFTCTGANPLNITGVGFPPDLLFVIHNNGLSWNTGGDADHAKVGFGFAVGTDTSKQAGGTIYSESGRNPTGAISAFRSGGVVVDLNGTQFPMSATGSDGFSISGGVGNGTEEMVYLAIRDTDGGTFDAGVDTQPLTDTDKVISSDVNPGAILMCGITKTASSTAHSDAHFTIGAYEANSTGCVWSGDLNGQTPNTNSACFDSDSIILTNSDPDTTSNGDATVTDLGTGQFTTSWTNTDGTARQFAWLAAETVDGNPCPTAFRFWADLV